MDQEAAPSIPFRKGCTPKRVEKIDLRRENRAR